MAVTHPDPLMTFDEVAERLRISPKTVRRMVQRGELRSVLISKRRSLVKESHVEHYIAAQTRRARP
jgi:excisionase family DNA binding protein